ncbi:MAG: phosphate ABC transporter permease PstA [Halobacteriota archaeon]
MSNESGSGSTVGEAFSEVSQLRGRVFEAVCLGATTFGLVMVSILLLYVANDALRPLSAEPGWYLVFFVTLALPALGLLAFYYVRDGRAVEVATASLGIPLVGLLVGGGLVVLFVEIITPMEWFALLVGLLVGAGFVYAHRQFRADAALERLFVLFVAPTLALVGIPALSVDFTATTPLTSTELFTVAFSTPALLPSVSTLVLSLPVLPVDWMLLAMSVTLPVALVVGRVIAARRDDGRGVREAVVGSLVVVSVGAFLAPIVGLNSENWVVLATTTLLPLGYYFEDRLRHREGLRGLLFPLVVILGAVVGAFVVRSLGLAGPSPWLDWQFLTSPTSRTPADAGIYPPLVGTVLMLVVIVISTFPIGVGAAIYLEEYAPKSGLLGRIVKLIQINIGNLAGVPSVVYGLLGLALFIRVAGLESGIVIVGGLTVGLLILPIVIISAQEAIRAVPNSMRQASYGMGATKWQTTRNVVLPEALPGILTGTILALGRAIGETAPLLMIGAAASVRLAPDGFFAKFSAMPRQIFAWSSEIEPEFRFGVLAAGVLTLLVVLLLMNGTAILIRNKYQRSS